MMKKNFWHIVAFAFLMPAFASAQAIVKGAGIVYTNGAPTHSVSQNTDAETAIDSTSGYWYEFNRDGLGWILAGFRVQEFPFSVAPTAAPGDKQSELLLNNVDSLYRWNGTAWKHLNKVGDPSSTNEGILGVGAGASNTSILLSNTTGATGVTIQASTGLSISETPSSNGGTIVLTNTAPDQTVSLTGAGITVITGTYPSFTITSTEVDGSITNELQTLANTSNATSHTTTLSNSGGSVQFVEGTGIGLATTGTSLNGVVTITNSSPDQTVSITGAGISVVTGTYPTFTITSTEVDGSITNEGLLGVGAGGASSSVLLSNTSTAAGVTINVAGILAISETTSANGGQITLTATEVDGSVTNELQTIANTSNATSHTATLSNSGGSIQLVEGSGITLTTTGTTLDGIVTIAATASATDLTFTGTGPYTLNSSTGTDVTITQGSGIVITRTSNDLSFAASDASATNELQTLANTSTGTTHTATLSNSGGSLQLAEGANVTLTTTGTTLDGIVTVAAAGTDLQFTGISPTFDLTSSTGTDVQFEAGTNITITRTGGTKLTIASSTAADGNGYYSGNGGNGGNGTIPSLTTSTITNQFTFSRATDDVGGLVPVRISVAAGNEPDFMSFVNGSDSILISKGDQEFEIDANKTLVVRSTELLYLIADSINISTVPTGFDNEATLLFVSPAGTIVKAEGLDPDIIRQNGAATNDVLKWNGSKWAPAAGGGGGTPAGSSFEVQYNNAGAFGSETVFQYDPTDNELVVGTTTANAAIHGRARNDTGASIFLAENNSANDVLKVNSDGYTQFGDNASLPRIYQTASAGAAVSYTAQGLTFEGIPTATTGLDLFSFLEATAAPTAGDFNVVRQTGTFNPTSGSASIDGFVTDPTINIATSASGLARGFVATPTLTSALGGYHAFATNINSGTNRWAFYGAGTADSRINGRLGIGGDPVSGFNLYSNAAIRIDGAVVSRGTGTNPASDLVTPQMRLWNTTATTGDIWYFASLNNGDFVVRSDNAGANQLVIKDAASGGQVQVTNTLRIGTFTGTPTQLNGTDGSGNVGVVNLGSGVTLQGIGELPLWNSNDAGSVTSLTATALADVTGLSFAVTANVKYEFWAAIKYSANNTTTGSAWSIDCPAGTVALQVQSATANNAQFFHAQNAENTLLASASSAYTSGNLAYVRGIVEPTSGGTCILRGATEVASNAITVQGTSNVNWREIK